MKLAELKETRKISVEKWHQAIRAYEQTKLPVYKDLKKVYSFLKAGKSVIDIYDVIKEGGLSEKGHPKLAVARASEKTVRCYYYHNGRVQYESTRSSKYDVVINECFPRQAQFVTRLETAVPIIPPAIAPEWMATDLYILWEVLEWKIIPPGDPYLLKRITPNMFVVLNQWDLTDVERAVMKGRL